jgi:hypothetical protein
VMGDMHFVEQHLNELTYPVNCAGHPGCLEQWQCLQEECSMLIPLGTCTGARMMSFWEQLGLCQSWLLVSALLHNKSPRCAAQLCFWLNADSMWRTILSTPMCPVIGTLRELFHAHDVQRANCVIGQNHDWWCMSLHEIAKAPAN